MAAERAGGSPLRAECAGACGGVGGWVIQLAVCVFGQTRCTSGGRAWINSVQPRVSHAAERETDGTFIVGILHSKWLDSHHKEGIRRVSGLGGPLHG